jgi:hypothetical protein
MSTESARPSRVRASDTEREQYASAVREAVGEGRLTLDEGDERLSTIYAAKFRDELRPVVADLPREEESAPGPHGPWGRDRRGPERRGPEGSGVRHGWQWGDPRRRFVRHAGFVALVAVVLISIWAAIGSHFFWPAIPLAFLAIGLFRHGMWLRWYGHRGWRR